LRGNRNSACEQERGEKPHETEITDERGGRQVRDGKKEDCGAAVEAGIDVVKTQS
jgi:hypothetical protein